MASERWQGLVRRLTGTLLIVLLSFAGNVTAGGQPNVVRLASGQAGQAQPTPAPPHPSPPPKGAHERGIVIDIRLSVPSPEIVIRTDVFGNVTQVYRITPRTSFERVDLDSQRGEAVDPRSIFPGDLVDISVGFSDEGKIAGRVTVVVREERGVVRDFGPAAIAFEDGRSFQLLPAVRVLISGRLGKREAVRPGSIVIIRINPRTREVTEIVVL